LRVASRFYIGSLCIGSFYIGSLYIGSFCVGSFYVGPAGRIPVERRRDVLAKFVRGERARVCGVRVVEEGWGGGAQAVGCRKQQ